MFNTYNNLKMSVENNRFYFFCWKDRDQLKTKTLNARENLKTLLYHSTEKVSVEVSKLKNKKKVYI